jgi:3-deoxy-7-phosphoheptulonate synthase / chorismate mutase
LLPTSPYSGTLARCRADIDNLNARLLELLEARGRIVETIAAAKRLHVVRIHDPQREDAMLEDLLARATGPYSPSQIERVFRCIFEVSRELACRADAERGAPPSG